MINNLQILRAFAALNVVLFHTIAISDTYNFKTFFLLSIGGWGANGVDIFFVISGFVMLYTQMNVKKSVYGFLKSRIIRIVPIYWFLNCLLLIIYFLFPNTFRQLVITPEWTISSFMFMSKLILDKYPIIYVGWTLELEMLFYFFFGLSLWFRKLSISLIFVSIGLVLIAISSSDFILFEFLGGIIVALVYKKWNLSKNFGLLILLIGFVLLCLSIHPSGWIIKYRVVFWGFPSVLIVLGVVTTFQFHNKLFEFLGNASYSIYLIQIMSIPLFYKIVSKLNLAINTDMLAIFCIITTTVGGAIMYLLVEKPMTNILRKIYIKH